ncbi:hypothetical protein MJO29_012361 [Puccinia striiformis f. sp. tritici]|nr:hypothetical protein MJO29_012361 [Puccinia striiformis f. sp. tritici]
MAKASTPVVDPQPSGQTKKAKGSYHGNADDNTSNCGEEAKPATRTFPPTPHVSSLRLQELQPVKWSTHHSKICRARRKSGQQASELLGEDSLYPMYHAMSKRVKNTLMKQCNATLLSLQQSCILVSECTYLDAHLDHVAGKPPKPYNCFDESLEHKQPAAHEVSADAHVINNKQPQSLMDRLASRLESNWYHRGQ